MKRAIELEKAIEHWDYVAPIIAYPKNDKELDRLTAYLGILLDKVQGNEKDLLMRLIDIMSDLIEAYEEEKYYISLGTGVDALRYLMDAHHLRQTDFPELGSQGVVSEILNGKRTLNLRQVKQLAHRFNVSASTFLDDEA